MKQARTLRRFPWLMAAALAFTFAGCEIINPDEEVPSYIHIPAYGLVTGFDQGTASHNITDAWVYVDQDIQGVYELPVTFPVLASGTHTITLRPGIKINGIASTRINYPFFASSEYSLDLVPGKVDTLKPVTSYQDDAGFAWIEGFENPGMSLQATPSSDTLMLKYKEGAFEGDFSGLIRLDEAHDYFEATSVDAFDLPGGLTPSYLELNFKADSRFIVGLIANGIGTVEVLEILVVNPAEEWKKIYINLGATVSRQSGILDYNVLFRAGLESGKDEAEILIDNIKLVHY